MRTFFGKPFKRWMRLQSDKDGELILYMGVEVTGKLAAVWHIRLNSRITKSTYSTSISDSTLSPITCDLGLHSAAPMEAESDYDTVSKSESCEWLGGKPCWCKIIGADDLLLNAIQEQGSDLMFEKIEELILENVAQGILDI